MRFRHLHYASGDALAPHTDLRPDVPLFLVLLVVLTAGGIGGAVLVMVGLV